MTFNPNIPQPDNLLSDSQVDFLDNNMANNTWSSVDHYALDDMTPNNGFHSHVTSPTPASSTHYSTTINTLLYGMQDNAGIGNLQYSRGPNNAVPGPITTLQSSSAGITLISGGTATILEFNPAPTPIPQCYGFVTASGISAAGSPVGLFTPFFWNGSNSGVPIAPTGILGLTFTGTQLQIVNRSANTLTKIAWTLRFERIWTPT